MLVGAAVAFVVTLAACPIVLTVLHRFQVVDDPNWRSSHTTSVPRGGGLAIAVGIAAALAVAPGLSPSLRAGLLAVGLGVGAVGLTDDLTGGVAPKIRLVGIVLWTAASLLWLAPSAGLGGPWQVAVVGVCLAWVVCYVNAFNFMDGINGISAGQVLVVAGAIAVAALANDEPGLATAGAAVAASVLAFLPFNFPRARMFLGDVGSYLLGALVAGLVIVAVSTGIPVETAAAGAALYAADTFATLVRRVRRGEVWHEAHREHVYQRLTDLGLSHVAVTSLVTTLAAACAALGAVGPAGDPLGRVAAGAGIAAVVAVYLTLPRLLRASSRIPAA